MCPFLHFYTEKRTFIKIPGINYYYIFKIDETLFSFHVTDDFDVGLELCVALCCDELVSHTEHCCFLLVSPFERRNPCRI